MRGAVTPRRGLAVRITALHTGIVAALLAVIAGQFLDVSPPENYGLCMACHGRDLVNWTVNAVAGTRFLVSEASLVYPVLTTVGVLLGALLGSATHGELKWSSPDSVPVSFLRGLLVMTFAVVAGGCSIRLLLRAASGELVGVGGFVGMAGGVVLATLWLRRRATR